MEEKGDKFSILRKELKDWEHEFEEKNGRKPTNTDIMNDPIRMCTKFLP